MPSLNEAVGFMNNSRKILARGKVKYYKYFTFFYSYCHFIHEGVTTNLGSLKTLVDARIDPYIGKMSYLSSCLVQTICYFVLLSVITPSVELNSYIFCIFIIINQAGIT